MAKQILLTKEKKEELEKDLKDLIEVRRKEIADKLDRYSENVEEENDPGYSEILEQKDLLEHKISEIEQILAKAKLISRTNTNRVSIGNTVKVFAGAASKEFQIVSKIEADPSQGKISDESPLGRKLLGKKVNDEVVIDTPSGEVKYKVVSIS